MNYVIVGRKAGQADVDLFNSQFEEICNVTLPVLIDMYKDGKTYDEIVMLREATQEEMDGLQASIFAFSKGVAKTESIPGIPSLQDAADDLQKRFDQLTPDNKYPK